MSAPGLVGQDQNKAPAPVGGAPKAESKPATSAAASGAGAGFSWSSLFKPVSSWFGGGAAATKTEPAAPSAPVAAGADPKAAPAPGATPAGGNGGMFSFLNPLKNFWPWKAGPGGPAGPDGAAPGAQPGPLPGVQPGVAPGQTPGKDVAPGQDPLAAGAKPGDPNAAKGPEKPVDPKMVAESANKLFKAMDGWGTDEDAIHNALRGKSPAEIAAIKAEYQDHFGRSLDADIKKEMSGKDLEEAQAALSGDPVKSAVAALDNAANGGLFGMGTDEKKIETVLENITDPAQRKQVVDAYQKKTGVSLDKMLKDEMSGNDLALSKALLQGDKTKANAVRLDEAMNGGFLGMGTDEEGVYKALESCKDETERKALAAAYQKKTGETLKTALGREFSGAEKDVATNLLKGDKVAADAARVKVAADDFWGTDEEGIFKSMEGKSKAERDQLIAAYNKQYGGKDGKSFDAMLKSELGGLDLEKAEQLKKDGKISDEFALKYATNGLGTNEELIKKTLEGKTKTEIDALRKTYKEKYGQDLDALLKSEASGRDGFEIGQLMKGKPTTPQEMIDRANEAYEFDRGKGSNWFSRGFTDMFSDSGQVLDYQHQRINSLAKTAGQDGKWSEAEAARLDKLTGFQQMDVKNYQEAKDSATNALATGTAIVVGAAVSIATAGTASPAVVAALSALLGGASSMAVKGVMLEGGYALEDIGVDALTTLASAASAGLLKLPGIDGQLNKLVGIADPTKATMFQTMLKGGISSAAKGGLDSTVGGLLNEANYQGDFGDFLKGMGTQVGMGMGSGFLSGSVGAGVGQKMGDGPQGMNPYVWSALKGGTSSMAGAAASNAINPAAYTGRPEDIAKQWFTTLGSAGLGGALDSIAETRGNIKEARKKAAEQQTPDGGPPDTEATQQPKPPAPTEEPAVNTGQKPPTTDPSADPAVTDLKAKVEGEKAGKPTAKPANTDEALKTEAVKAQADAEAVKEGKPKATEPTDAAAKPKTTGEAEKPVATEDAAKTKAAVEKGVDEPTTLDKKGKPKRPLSQEEKTLEEWRKQDTRPEDQEAIAHLEKELEARRRGDQESLKQLADEAAQRKEKGQRAADGDVLSVREARLLHEFGSELGVDKKSLPKASTVEESLRAKGMSDDEIGLLKGTLNKDQQARMDAETAQKLQDAANAGKPADQHRHINDDSKKDVLGKLRQPASPEELAVLLKANMLLFEDVKVGQTIAKVITEDTANRFYLNGTENPTVSGDVGMLRNTEGMNAQDRIRYLGLDYVGSQYTNHGDDGKLQVNPSAADKLRVLETKITPEMHDKIQVPMGFDLHQAAQVERVKQLAQLQAAFPDASPADLEYCLPRLLQTDSESGKFKHIQLRGRFEQADPSAGFGYTASQGLRDADSGQYFMPNQELTLPSRAKLGAGSEIAELDEDGHRNLLSKMNGNSFSP